MAGPSSLGQKSPSKPHIRDFPLGCWEIEDGGATRLVHDCPDYQKARPDSLPTCSHVEDTIKQDGDGHFFGDPTTEPDIQTYRVWVPVFRRPKLEVITHLVFQHDSNLITVDMLMERQATAKNNTVQVAQHFDPMGVVSRGSGRAALRLLVIEHLASLPYVKGFDSIELQCAAPQHRGDLSPYELWLMKASEEQEITVELCTDLYLRYQGHMCLPCSQDDGVPVF